MNRFANPVLLKELKLRFRAYKSFLGLVFYLGVLMIFVSGFLMVYTQFRDVGFFRPSDSFTMFSVLTMLQLGLIMFMTPALTAGAISSEREKQTLNILLTTTQSSTQIIIGKLLSSVAFLILMLIAGLPLYSIVFLFGGVSPSQFVSVIFYYLLTLIAIGSIGIMFSTVTKKTIVSMIATYGAMIFLGGITAFFFFIGVSADEILIGTNTPNGTPHSPILYFWISINPVAQMLSVLLPEVNSSIELMVGISLPISVVYIIVYILIIILSLTIASRKLRVNMKHSR